MSHIVRFGTLDLTDAIESWENSLDTRLNMMQVPKRHGGLVSEVPVLSVRMIRLKGRTQHMTYEDLRDTIDLMERRLNAGRQKLQIWDDRYIFAYKQSFSYGFVPGAALTAIDFMLDFVCDDPFWYDFTAQSSSQVLTSSDTSLGNGIYRKSFSANNGGTAFVYPVITVTANQGVALTNVTVRNLTNNRTFIYSGTVNAGNAVVIDCGLLTVKNNGVEDLTNWNGLMASFDVGTNNIQIEGQPATYLFEWTNRYF